MKRTFLRHILPFLIIGIAFSTLIAQTNLVQSTAGGTAKSDNFSLVATVGQFSPANTASSDKFALLSGFIYTLDNSFATINASFVLAPGKSKENYRLISIPAVLKDPGPAAVLEDDLGKYDKKKWRLYDCRDGSSSTTEFPNTRPFNPGVALFLLTKESGKTIDIENGYWVDNIPFTIDLQKGWNLIGNPYNMNIPVANIKLQSDDTKDSLKIKEYTGGWQPVTKEIVPWHGYALHVNGNAKLIINPLGGSGNPSSQFKENPENITAKTQWEIRISAKSDEAEDLWNFVGVSEAASIERDRLDEFEPPVIGDFISVYFPHPEWPTLFKNLTADYRPGNPDGYIFDIDVQSNVSAPATLNFANLESLPRNYAIRLVDVGSKIITDLRAKQTYTFGLNNNENGQKFQLLVGSADFIEAETKDLAILPEKFQLYQNYPNPFNPATNILFDLPESEVVTVKIVNMLGQEVAVLSNEQEFQAGRHLLVWDGKNSSGQNVGSGVYFYHLITREWQEKRQMTLIK